MKNNNPIIKHKFTADPTVIEFNGVVYLYTGHDEPADGMDEYVMNEWLCFSSHDFVTWREHPVPMNAKTFSWAKGDAYASKVIYRNQKFYWFAAVTHGTIPGKAIGVAVSQSPTGPFVDALGAALISSDMIDKGENFDPSVIIDSDNQAYLFWGKEVCYWSKLSENMIELEGSINTITLPEFSEGVHVHKRGNWYYLCYGYGMPEKVCYARSSSIKGPWEFCGIVNEVAGNCETNRVAILDYKGKTYCFYHNGVLKHGGSHRRSVCIDYLNYNDDGTIIPINMTSQGVNNV